MIVCSVLFCLVTLRVAFASPSTAALETHISSSSASQISSTHASPVTENSFRVTPRPLSQSSLIKGTAAGTALVGLGISSAIVLPALLDKEIKKDPKKVLESLGIILSAGLAGGAMGSMGGFATSMTLIPKTHRDAYVRKSIDSKTSLDELNKQDIFGNTIAHYAAKRTDMKVLEELKNKGVDFSLKNNDGQSVFSILGSKNTGKLVKAPHNLTPDEILKDLEWHKDPNARGYLYAALAKGEGDVFVNKIFEQYPNVDVNRPSQFNRPLNLLLSKDTMLSLLEHGGNPNLRGTRGNTALQSMIQQEKNHAVLMTKLKILLEHGANPAIKNDYKQNSLHVLLQTASSFQSTNELYKALISLGMVSKSALDTPDILGRYPGDYISTLPKHIDSAFIRRAMFDLGVRRRSNIKSRVPIFLNLYKNEALSTAPFAYHGAIELGMGNGLEGHYLISGTKTVDFTKANEVGFPSGGFHSKILLGYVPKSEKLDDVKTKFDDFVRNLGQNQYKGEAYNVLSNNCLEFSYDLAMQLEQGGLMLPAAKKFPTQYLLKIFRDIDKNLVLSKGLASVLPLDIANSYNSILSKRYQAKNWYFSRRNFDLIEPNQNEFKEGITKLSFTPVKDDSIEMKVTFAVQPQEAPSTNTHIDNNNDSTENVPTEDAAQLKGKGGKTVTVYAAFDENWNNKIELSEKVDAVTGLATVKIPLKPEVSQRNLKFSWVITEMDEKDNQVGESVVHNNWGKNYQIDLNPLNQRVIYEN